YSPDKRFLQESREPRLQCGFILHALQFRADSQDAEGNASDGSGSFRPCLEHRGNRRTFGLKGREAMQVPKEVIESLAQAWAAEAKRLRSRTTCDWCCRAEVTAATRFKPGHDARL